MRERYWCANRCVLAGFAFFTFACVATAGPAGGPSGAADEFETVPDRSPAELLPPAMVSGPNFHVVDPVHGDGLMNRFVLETHFGTFDAYGRAALAIRIQEVAALTALSKLSGIEIIAGGVTGGVQSEVKTTVRVVTNPVGIVTGIPKGITHLFEGYKASGQEAVSTAQRSADSLRSGGSAGAGVEQGVKQGEDAARSYAEHYLGVTAAERAWYKKLGVSPYTDNKVLRDAVHKAARTEAVGSFGVKFAGLPAIPGIDIAERTVDAIYNEDPAAVRARTRKTLAGYGLDAKQIESWMNAPLLNPARQQLLLSIAEQLDGVSGRAELFSHAIGLTSNEEVQVYLVSAALLAKAHAGRALASMVPGVRLPAARTSDGGLVVCGAFEAVYWTQGVAQAAEQLRHSLPALPEGASREMWLLGTVSDRARREAQNAGWQLHEVPDSRPVG
jgi:hypothetical protein